MRSIATHRGRGPLRVGVLDLLVDEAPSRHWLDLTYRAVFKKQYASIMPQAVAVWCRQLGHRVRYATYYGQREPDRLLPDDLDVLFVSAYTQASALAYALARLYRRRGVRTIIGGPHARAFPRDCLRFFDVAVHGCDKALVADILRGAVDPGTLATTARPLIDLPSVEERMPEIAGSAFARGRPVPTTTVPLLASVGCPYTCDFCIDWQSPYAVLPPERLAADLAYLARRLPGVMVSFHDPNFAVRFDQVLSVIERTVGGGGNPYIMESSLSVLRGERLRRLRDTRCIYVAPGIESWEGYAGKAGAAGMSGRRKLGHLVERFTELHAHRLGLQANFMFGTDADRGEEPVELTKEFIRRLPFVWPAVNVPTPFGNTPLYDRYLAEGRILERMPFTFYYTPYLVTTLQHYEPGDYYAKLADIYAVMTSNEMLWRRLRTRESVGLRFLHAVRTFGMRQDLAAFGRLERLLRTDPRFRAFHEGRSTALPELYHREYERKLGRYASLLSRGDRTPHLEPAAGAGARNAARAAPDGAGAEPSRMA
jgi:radical SAM superfamily enzyme YgiQ (UPF0313 family)